MLLWFLAGVALAHEDRILPILADGTLDGLPADYGPVRVAVFRAPADPTTLTRVRLTSPRFSVSLNSCVLTKLRGITYIQASGSWYHERAQGGLPAYVSLTFYSHFDPGRAINEHYSVTFSLIDGRILVGGRAWDPLIGPWRMQHINPADKCSHWKRLGA